MPQVTNAMLVTTWKKWVNAVSQREALRYLIGGAIITGINISLYTGLVLANMPIRWANLFALSAAKITGFFINKYYVYQTNTSGWKNTGCEAGKYVFARVMTGIFEYFGVVLLVEQLASPALTTKYIITLFVIVGNYLLGKYFVFAVPVAKSVK